MVKTKNIDLTKLDFDALKKIKELSKEYIPKGIFNNLNINKLPKEFDRFSGLDVEDEFLLISKILGNCYSLNKIDQSKYINNDQIIVSDYIGSYYADITGKKGKLFRALLEIKKREGEVWSISKNDFNKRINFSKIFDNLPLNFVIKFIYKGIITWVIVTSEYVKSHNYKVNMLEAPKDSLFDMYTSNKSIFINKGIQLKKIYSNIKSEFFNKKYGYLQKVLCTYKEKEFEIEKSSVVILDIIPIIKVKKEKSETIVIHKSEYNHYINLYSVLLNKFEYKVKKNNFIGIIKSLDKNDIILRNKIINYLLDYLYKLDLIIPVTMLPSFIKTK